MKALVLISGIVREPGQSLATLDMLRRDRFDLDVVLWTWVDTSGIREHTWNRRESLEPTIDLLAPYRAKRIILESWALKAKEFQKTADRWTTEYGCTTVKNLGVIGMFFGIQEVADQSGVLDAPWVGHVLQTEGYDIVLRLRFDCKLLDSPLKFGNEPGWVVPGGARPEDEELVDQISWYLVDKKNLSRSVHEISAYFETYSCLDGLIRQGSRCHPETLLYRGMNQMGVSWRRVPASWEIN